MLSMPALVLHHNPLRLLLTKWHRNAKAALAHASDSSDSVRMLAVQSYASGFRVVMDYNDQMAKLSPCSRCLKEAAIHKAAELDLKASFRTLSEAVDAST